MNPAERARAALRALDPNMPRKEWVRAGAAAYKAGVGFDDFDAWSRCGGNYGGLQATRTTWRSCARMEQINEGTLFYLARAAGWTDQEPVEPRASEPPHEEAWEEESDGAPCNATALWEAGEPAHAHPYVRAGQIDPDTVRIEAGNPDALLTPFRDLDGALVTLQRIFPNGEKRTLRGRMGCSCYQLGDVHGDCDLYVAEGAKTAGAVARAMYQAAVVATGGVARFGTVGAAWRARYPARRLVYVADRGTEAATEAAARATAAQWCPMPENFKPGEDAFDYEALYESEALEAFIRSNTRKPAPDEPEPPRGGAKEREQEKAQPWEPQVIAATDLFANPPEKPVFLVDGFLPVGLTVIAAPPKCNKSVLALQIGRHISAGMPLWYREVRQGPVLYLDLENGNRRIYDRLQQMGTRPADIAGLSFVTEWEQGNRDALLRLLETLKPVQVTIDTWRKFCRPLDKRQDQYAQEQAEVAWLQREAMARGISIVLVLHTTKAIAESVLSSVSGSYAVTGGADAILVLQKQDSDRRIISTVGRDLPDTRMLYRLGDDLNFRFMCDADEMVTPEQLRYLQAIADGCGTQAMIAKALGFGSGAVSRMVEKLATGGSIWKPGGFLRLTPAGLRLLAISKGEAWHNESEATKE